MGTNKKTTIISVFLGIVILVFVTLLIYPKVLQIKKESENLVFQKNRLTGLEARIKNLKEFQTTYKTYRLDFERISQLFINSAEPIGFIEFLEREAAASRLPIEITPFSPQELMPGEYWPSMNFRLAITCPFPNFLEFLEKLESSPYLIEILNLDIRRLTEKGLDTTSILLIKAYAQK